ncbi:MAG TPA: Flp family type IVb pilin [bacterium]|nr:Flp family type IVb pilin [bacterium]HPN34938.1 Flp family type IVb pilin [bacterium]
MFTIKRLLKGLFDQQKGQTLSEYALILVLIAIVAIVALTLLGVNITGVINNVATAI